MAIGLITVAAAASGAAKIVPAAITGSDGRK